MGNADSSQSTDKVHPIQAFSQLAIPAETTLLFTESTEEGATLIVMKLLVSTYRVCYAA